MVASKNIKYYLLTLLFAINIGSSFSQKIESDTTNIFNEEIEYIRFNPDSANPNYIPPYIRLLPSDLLYNNKWDTLDVGRSKGLSLNKSDTVTLILHRDNCNKFVFPYKGQLISDFGFRGRRPHTGTDIKCNLNDPIVSAFDGVVRMSRYYGGYGNMVVVRHSNGLETLYGHLSKRAVKANQKVRAGEVIGYGGRTGRATCTHLHFETRYLEVPFNPHIFIDFANFKLLSDTITLVNKAYKYEKLYKGKAKTAVASNSKKKSKSKKNNSSIVLVDNNTNDSNASKSNINSAEIVNNSTKSITNQNNIQYHTIKKGDTLYSLAKRNGTTVDNLCKINNITPNTTLNLGKKIKIHK